MRRRRAATRRRAPASGRPLPGSLDAVLRPRSVAVIGASRQPKSIGREILHNLIAFGFTGPVYPVNPHADSVHSLKAFPSVEKIPGPVDLGVVVVPRDRVLDVVAACARKRVAGLVIITAGFRESGPAGAEIEQRLAALVRRHHMRMVGPNCMGVVNTDSEVRLDASFAAARPVPGRVGFMSQSGALGEAILATAADIGLGIAHFVSLGNKTDVSGNDLLEYWEKEDGVDLILMYLESFGNPHRFTSLARRIARIKPIIAVKSGRTAAGARAAVSHTGALAGREVGAETLLRQCGVIRVDTMAEMFTLAQAFANQPLPKGRRVAVVTNAGGPGILATDALIGAGLELSPLAPATRKRLRRVLPPESSGQNPIDLIASADAPRYAAVLGPVLADPTVDAALVIFVTPVTIDAYDVARRIVAATSRQSKTVLTCFMGKTRSEEALVHLKQNRIPVYPFPEDAVRALAAMASHRDFLTRPEGRVIRYQVRAARAAAAVRVARRRAVRLGARGSSAVGGQLLDATSCRTLMKAYGLPVVPVRSVTDTAESVAAARALGYPVALKAISPRFPHKTEVGAVRLDLRTGDEVAAVFEEMAPRLRRIDPQAVFLVQAMLQGGRETILGGLSDSSYGAILMFGLGGIEVEVVRDVAYALCPITDREAERLILSIRGAPLLTGFRGAPPVDLKRLASCVGRLSQMMIDLPRLAEVELNPLIVAPRGSPFGAVDVRMRIAR